MCSACSGQYEDPEVTQESSDYLETCTHTDEVRWDPSRGQFRCLRCETHISIPELMDPWPDQDINIRL